DSALNALDTWPAALGHADDGGWWAIGLRHPEERVFLGVEMSAADTGRRQQERLEALGLGVALLPELADLDTVSDLPAVVDGRPTLRTALLARRLGLLGSSE
ncbi:MAG: DUF2064 domain-containing protein, partial [Actinobacteria bacterium]|nr:DUF2064 domain-containing protein [Actinomycetota bacterium]